LTSSSGLKFLITDPWALFVDDFSVSVLLAWVSEFELASAPGKTTDFQRSLTALAAREIVGLLDSNEPSPVLELESLGQVLMSFCLLLFLGSNLSSFWDNFFSGLTMVGKLLRENIVLEKETRSNVELLCLLVVLLNCEWTIFAMPTYISKVATQLFIPLESLKLHPIKDRVIVIAGFA
jgi:hypothetical protein